MRKIFRFFRVPAICLVLAIGSHLYYLTTLSPKEKYPDDEYLARAENKNALIIVAHDDDMIGSSGTMSMLCSEGWVIREMCFYQKGGLYLKSDSLKNPVRKRSLNQAAMIQGPQGTDQVDFNLRKDMETERSYMPMPYELFSQNYKIGSMLKIIGDYIRNIGLLLFSAWVM